MDTRQLWFSHSVLNDIATIMQNIKIPTNNEVLQSNKVYDTFDTLLYVYKNNAAGKPDRS